MTTDQLLDFPFNVAILVWGEIVDTIEILDGSNPGLGEPRKTYTRRVPDYGCGCNVCCFNSPPEDQAARKCSNCGVTLY